MSSTLTLSEYQKQAVTTAIYPREYAIIYPCLEIAGEGGEISDKVKKILRDCQGVFTEEKKQEISKEMGDLLWPLANLANDLGLDLGIIAQQNLDKLASRKARNVLGGSGDER